MRHTASPRRLWLTAAALVLGAAWASAEDEGQTKVPIDARKTLVERRTERLLGDGASQEVRLDLPAAEEKDLRKDFIETPTERLVGAAPTDDQREFFAALTRRLEEIAAPPAARPEDPANPRVAPGLVRWHPDLAAAQAASRASGKPVLLFQMLGNLDDEFC